ncbi:MAG: ferredoxin--NADP reductase [Proteobacteria bacterium]|nr:ferredoxin--NADP reductase [Pseudomonadota bacterium]
MKGLSDRSDCPPRRSPLRPCRLQTVRSVHHWTDELFSFRTTRDRGFRFASGQFTMIGLRIEGRPVLRAYSIASAHYDEELEFFSIKVPDGELTSRLKNLTPGDEILVGAKATGTLLLDSLMPGRNLYLLGTGTGLAPFLSLVRDSEVYERFERVVLVHGCRHVRDLAYRSKLADELPADEILGDLVRDKLIYYPTVTREPFRYRGRISHLLENGTLARDVGLPPIDRETDRFMLCGSMQMLADLRRILEQAGLNEGSTTRPAEFVVEKAFVE